MKNVEGPGSKSSKGEIHTFCSKNKFSGIPFKLELYSFINTARKLSEPTYIFFNPMVGRPSVP